MLLHWIVLLPALASLGLYVIATASFLIARRRGSTAPEPARWPKVTIFKPLAGADDDLWENLSSFSSLDYPDYEIVIGVASWTDKAAPVARRFRASNPHLRIKIVRTDPKAATNPKVSQLVGMTHKARGEIFVVSDSNVRVARGYLRGIVAELSRPGVGLTSNLFVGTGERSLGAMLENLQVSASIMPTLVAASTVAGEVLTVGKSMSMWRAPLDAIGGFESVASVLAEDHVLGKAFERAGYAVTLCPSLVENRNVRCGLKRTYERHSRWAKMRRGVAPRAWLLEWSMLPMLVALATWLLAPSRDAAAVLALSCMTQISSAALCMRVARGRWVWWAAPVEILRTVVIGACWASSFVSRRVEWRGHPFLVLRDSRIVPAPTRSWPRLRALRRAWATARA